MPAFEKYAMKNGAFGLFAALRGCPPLLGVMRPDRESSFQCAEFNDAVISAIITQNIKQVILIGRWSWYIYGVESNGREIDNGAIAIRADKDIAPEKSEHREKVFRTAFTNTVTQLRMAGVKVSVVAQPPTYPVDIPRYLAYSALLGISATGKSRLEVSRKQQFQNDLFVNNNVNLIDTNSFLCPSKLEHCLLEVNGKSFYRDYNHLSTFGAISIADALHIEFDRLMQ
jgi:hypothetical protein